MRHHRGFTLLEVLIALAVIAIGVMAAMRAIGVAAGGIEDVEVRQVAGWMADNRLTEIRALGLFPDIGSNQGEATMGRWHLYWHEDIKTTPNPLFRRIDVSVYAASSESHALARLSGFAVKPLR
jgi:general secretion pathway protein I